MGTAADFIFLGCKITVDGVIKKLKNWKLKNWKKIYDKPCLLVLVLVLSHFSCVQPFVTLWTVGSFVHGILQAKVLELVAISSSRRLSPPRGQTCIGRQVLTGSTT